MTTLKLAKKQKTLTPMHPALDVVDGVLYVAVEVDDEDKGTIDVILTSNGGAFTPDEWPATCRGLSLQPLATVDLRRCQGTRWNNEGIQELMDKSLAAPTWNEVYNAIYQALDERIVVVDNRYLTILTLHIMMTYFHALFDFLPILHPLGPSESGKSRAGDAECALAFNGIKQGSATRAVIFRYAHMGRFTQVLAEADHLANVDSDDQFVRDLQASCSKGEAIVDVAENAPGKKFQPVTYHGFSPRVIISTKKFKARTLRNRCIRLDFVKTPDADQTKLRRTMTDDAVWAPLRDMLYRVQLVRWQDVVESREALKQDWVGPTAPRGRVFDKWLPLASIAQLVSEDVLEQVKNLALEDMLEQRQDAAGDFSAVLFKFLYWYVVDNDQDTIEASRTQLWEAFAGDYAKDDVPLYAKPPAWLKATSTTVTSDQLKKWIKGPGVLVKELQNLHLVPRETKGRKDTNYYVLDKKRVEGTAQEYLGDYILVAESNNDDDEPPKGCRDCRMPKPRDFMVKGSDGQWRCGDCERKLRPQQHKSA